MAFLDSLTIIYTDLRIIFIKHLILRILFQTPFKLEKKTSWDLRMTIEINLSCSCQKRIFTVEIQTNLPYNEFLYSFKFLNA